MVGVEVGQEHHPQAVDPKPVEAAVHRSDVGPGVDQQALPRAGRHEQRVALPDVAGDDDGVLRRPAPDRLAQRPAERDEPDHARQRQRPEPREAPEQAAEDQEQRGELNRPGGADRPPRHGVGQRGAAFGHEHQPADRPAGEPDEHVAGGGTQRGHHGGEQPQHRRGRDRRSGEQVRRQRDEADLAAETGDERGGGQAGGRADRECVGDRGRAPPPAQRPRPPRGQQHDGGRRGHGEGEPAVSGEGGLDEQQHQHAGAQRRDGDPLPPRSERDQRDGAHDSRAQDARARPREHHEAGQRSPGHQRLDPAVDRPPAQRPQHPGHDDRDVRPRDGGEMGQARAPEVLGQHRLHRAGVAHDEPRQQPAGTRPEDARCGPGQALTQVVRDPLRPPRRAHRGRRAPGGQDRHEVAVARQGHRRPDAHRLARGEVGPRFRGREEQHVVPDPDRPVAEAHSRRRRVGDDPRRPGAGQPAGQVAQLQLHLQGAALLRRRPERGGVDGQRPQRRSRRAHGQGGENAEHDEHGRRPSPDQEQRETGRRRRHDDQHPGRQDRGGEGGQPRRGRGRRQAQVDPGPAAGPGHTLTRSFSCA